MIAVALVAVAVGLVLAASKGNEIKIPLGAILHAFVTLQPMTGGKIDDLVGDFIDFTFQALLSNAEVPFEKLGATLKECITYALKHPAPALVGGGVNMAMFGVIRKLAKRIGGPGVRIPGVCFIQF